MKRLFAYLTLVGATITPVVATDYTEEEPNDSFPPTFLTGNPVFQTGDRLLGAMDSTEADAHYLTFAGTGATGIYRYTFFVDPGATGDSTLDLFDANPADLRFFAGNDDVDFDGGDLSSRVSFDVFDTTGLDSVFGVVVQGFNSFNYAFSWEREEVPVDDLGVLAGSPITTSFTTVSEGGNWYSFTLDTDATVTIDTSDSDSALDSELILVNSAGETIGGNDDIDFAGGDFLSSITASLTAGTYYVAAGTFNSIYNWDTGTDTSAGYDRTFFWGGTDEEPFTLTLSAAPVPEPATMAVLGLGAIALLRRRRKV